MPHPLCTECTELLFELMTRELDALKKERERLLGFEKEVVKRREEATKALLGDKARPGTAAAANGVELKEALERDIVKVRARVPGIHASSRSSNRRLTCHVNGGRSRSSRRPKRTRSPS